MIQSYRDLDVWRKSMDLAVRVYGTTDRFPRSEMFGLRSQLRRAATSIPSNIAEGKAIGGLSYQKHLRIAHGSEAELQAQIELARRLKFVGEVEAQELLNQVSEVGRMLVGLLRSLQQ